MTADDRMDDIDRHQDKAEADDAAEHARQDEVTAVDHDRLERIQRWFKRRWAVPFVLGLLAIVAAYSSINSNANTAKLNTQGAELTVLQAEVQQLVNFDTAQTAAQAKSSAALNQFFAGFIAEQNYLCRIASARAVISGLEAPPTGICQVALGRAPPTPTPSG